MTMFDWDKAGRELAAESRRTRLLMWFNMLPIISGNWCTVAHDDLDERMRAMTLHHVDLSLLPLTYTYDADALALFSPVVT